MRKANKTALIFDKNLKKRKDFAIYDENTNVWFSGTVDIIPRVLPLSFPQKFCLVSLSCLILDTKSPELPSAMHELFEG